MKGFCAWTSLLLIASLSVVYGQGSSATSEGGGVFFSSAVAQRNATSPEASDVDSLEVDGNKNSSTASPTATTLTSATTTSPITATEVYIANNEFLGIPGTTQTNNGYDTALGNEPICWIGAAAKPYENGTTTAGAAVDISKTVFPNPLVADFVLLGETEIKKSCPKGNSVKVYKPIESVQGERLRTLRYYNYTLQVEIDLSTLDGDYIITDNGTSTIALQVVTCSLGKSGFCSPFVHEQANLRDAIAQSESGQPVANTTKVKGDLHGGTHIHSPWIFMDLGTNLTWNQTVTVPVIVNHPDDYFVIGTVQLYTGVNDTVAYRWDFSSALDASDGRYVQYQAPYAINEVSTGVLYFSYAAIAIASVVLLFLIFQTIRHRNQPVLLLSQADFLLVFLFAALLATIFTFLLEPKSNAYCRISYPLILIPVHVMYAITVGRLWRIHAVISPLLLEHLNKGKTSLTQRFVEALTYISFKLSNLFVKQEGKRRQTVAGSVKQQISQFQLALVVALFTLPQFVIQLVAFIFQPQKRVIEFNIDESVGRASCDSGVDTAHNLITYSFSLLILLVIVLLFMAHSSRKLPSLFNETHVIYDSTFLSMVVMCLGAAVIILTSGPDTSPNVEYLVSLVLILSITLNSGVRILMPKLRMVWEGEVVIVSKLVTDHHRKAREKQMEKTSVLQGVSGFDPSNNGNYQSSFTGNGDYDTSQDKKLLVTLHSNSCDTGMMGRRSSKEFSEVQPQSLTEEPFNSKSGAKGKTVDLIDNMLEPDVNEGDTEAITSLMDGAPTHTPRRVDGSGDQTDDHATPVGDDLRLEAAVGAAIPSGSDEGATEKPISTFERRFLNAMAKGLSSFRHSNIQSNDATDNDTSPKRVECKSPKRGAQEPQKRLSRRMVVTEDETPARRLVLRMLDLQDQLEEINNKIMSGFAVTHEDWSLITKLTSRLDRTFKSEVEFEWDIERGYQKSLRDVMPADMTGAVATDSKQGESNGLKTPDRSNTNGYAIAVKPSLKNGRRKGTILNAQVSHNTDATSGDSNVNRTEKAMQDDSSVASFFA